MSPHAIETDPSPSNSPELWITGLGAQYPPYVLTPEHIEKLASRFCNIQSPGIKKFLEVNKNTGIQTRAAVRTYEYGFGAQSEPPSIVELDQFYRKAGVDLAAQACRKALREWGGDKKDITHTIAVTCTTQGNPGYDLLVNKALGLDENVDRMLLHGVGCAGGLAIMRAAAQIAAGATARKKPARILSFACELCTPSFRYELAELEQSSAADAGVAGALFADGAAAFVLCNSLGLADDAEPLFQLLDWGNALIQGTVEHMGFYAGPQGFRTILTRDVPSLATKAVKPMFQSLVPEYSAKFGTSSMGKDDFDWALHPGGQAIIDGVKDMMDLSDHQLRASREIYRTRGNSSSPTVLIVLDRLRSMGRGSNHIVATSFGPGMAIEMAFLRRCRKFDEEM